MVTASTAELPVRHYLNSPATFDPANGRRASLFIEDSDPIFLPHPRQSLSRETSFKEADVILSPYLRSPVDASDRSVFLKQALVSPGSSPASTDSHRHSIDMGSNHRISSPSTSGDASPTSLKIDTTWAPIRSTSAHRDTSRSPNPLDAPDVRRLPGRVGALGLATMHEETDQTAPHRDPQPLARSGYVETGSERRLPRHRSASSAAALALHGTGTAFSDRWSSTQAGRIAAAVPPRTPWEREVAPSTTMTSYEAARSQPQIQRGFSSSLVETLPTSISPFMSSPGGYSDVSHDKSLRNSTVPSQSDVVSSPYMSANDYVNHTPHLSSEFGSHQRSQSGLDSRRHSVAVANPYDSTGIIGDHRRALGFEVGVSGTPVRTYAGGSDFGARDIPRRALSGLVRSGGLVFSEEDLAGDRDHLSQPSDAYRLSSHQQQSRSTSQNLHARMPTNTDTSSMTRTLAASMPSAFDGMTFGTGAHPIGSDSSRTGFESLSSSCDVMLSPTHQSGGLRQDAQQNMTDVSRQLRNMSISAADQDGGRLAPVRRTSIFSEHHGGAETVRASPGNSQSDSRKDVGWFGLSAQAQSFSAKLPTPPSSASYDRDITSASVLARQGVPSGHTTMPLLAQIGYANVPALSPYGMPKPQQVDTAFSSLATLGPLPPSSIGPAPIVQGPHTDLQDLGKGVALGSLSKDSSLYIVEFKQGRTDLFFRAPSLGRSHLIRQQETISRGDLVIVEADRGKDLGTVVNDSITVEQVQAFLAHQSDLATGSFANVRASDHLPEHQSAAGLGISPNSPMSATATAAGPQTRPLRSINPKRLFAKATPANTSTLYSKAQDEERALQLCCAKVNQRGLPMTVVAAEMQWDRRKLTFYYMASTRVDFRDLVKELFRLYKTRIWMCHLSHPSGTGMG